NRAQPSNGPRRQGVAVAVRRWCLDAGGGGTPIRPLPVSLRRLPCREGQPDGQQHPTRCPRTLAGGRGPSAHDSPRPLAGSGRRGTAAAGTHAGAVLARTRHPAAADARTARGDTQTGPSSRGARLRLRVTGTGGGRTQAWLASPAEETADG